MVSFNECVTEYKHQLNKGMIQKAYKGLLEYLMALRTYFQTKYPDHCISGTIYEGYMDMSYFSFTPQIFKDLRLKIAVVFLHEACKFEVWLSGYNKQIQEEYWNLIKNSGWNQYALVPTIKGADAILVHTLAEAPDFGDLDAVTRQIEQGVVQFTSEVEKFLSTHKPS